MNRLYTALLAYAAIAALAWKTLSDEQIKFGGFFEASPRRFVFVVMALLALLTLFEHWKRRAQARLDDRRDE